MRQYIIPAMIAFAITAILTPVLIPILRGLKASNTEREEGVQEHLKKAGTPTMGGIAFVIGICIASLIYIREYHQILPVLLMTVAFGLIGFIDDYLKVVLHSSDGLKDYQKFGLQLIVTAVFAVYLLRFSSVSTELVVPFSRAMINPGILTVPLLFFVILGTVNGVNFTDGVDGLASSVTIVVAAFFALEDAGLAPIACAVIGALMGFLIYNCYPAKIFMGDTGSLALGGFVATMAYMQQKPLFILLIGFIYLIEIVSVIMQVSYFKATKGKRIFKMTPIHHHFELSGWSETRVVTIFTIVTAILCMIASLH